MARASSRLNRVSAPNFVVLLAVVSMTGCEVREANLCDTLLSACGGRDPANWYAWCQSDCVPAHARTVPCDENAACVLCDAERTDASTHFALPTDELEYLWTFTEGVGEPVHPPSDPPTGTAFDDGFVDGLGAWVAYEPFASLDPLSVGGFCEPGPNRYLAANVASEDGGMALRAMHLPDGPSAPYCPGGRCATGPYVACGEPPSGCQYGDVPEMTGLGDASQADRYEGPEASTYGLGRYRAILETSGVVAGSTPEPSFVYAFFSQSHEPCRDGVANEINTSEIDVEISSGEGSAAGGAPFCVASEMCLLMSTWVSSMQGVAAGGRTRHEVSGFRFRAAAIPARAHTYGWDWSPDEVRFVYDPTPTDCDEAAGACDAARTSLAVCRHTEFVPHRPAPLHFQLWNAWWAGGSPRGTPASMRVERVWHEPR